MKDQRYFNCKVCSKQGTPDNPLDGDGVCGRHGERMNGSSIDWSAPICTVLNGLKPLIHQTIEVFDGRVHVLTFRSISNPIIYDHWGNPLAQINKEYIFIFIDIESMRNTAKINGDSHLCFDIENYSIGEQP